MKFQFCEKAFSSRLEEAKALCDLSKNLGGPSADTVLRGALLLSVSAFDFLVHELVRVECLHRIENGAAVDLEIPLMSFRTRTADLAKECDLIIRKNHSYKAFASSKGVKEAYRPLSTDVWGQFEKIHGGSLQAQEEQLDAIWRWRNRVAHEGDYVPSVLTFQSWPIFRADVEDAIAFFTQLGAVTISSTEKL